MANCEICGRSIGMPGNRYVCENCYPIYEREMREGKYPPGLSEEAKREFSYRQWVNIKAIERDLQLGYISMAEAVARMEAYVQRLNDFPALRESLARKREAARKLHLY